MYCANGVLVGLKRVDDSPTTTTTSTTDQRLDHRPGRRLITVTGGDGGKAVLTCAIGNTSPSTSGFSTGEAVRMYCLNGSLYQLRPNDPSPVTTTTTATTTSTTPQK
jgi:hypothetical protein